MLHPKGKKKWEEVYRLPKQLPIIREFLRVLQLRRGTVTIIYEKDRCSERNTDLFLSRQSGNSEVLKGQSRMKRYCEDFWMIRNGELTLPLLSAKMCDIIILLLLEEDKRKGDWKNWKREKAFPRALASC